MRFYPYFLELLIIGSFTSLHAMQEITPETKAFYYHRLLLLGKEFIILASQLEKSYHDNNEKKVVFEGELWAQLLKKGGAVQEYLSYLDETPETIPLKNKLNELEDTFKTHTSHLVNLHHDLEESKELIKEMRPFLEGIRHIITNKKPA